MASKQRTRQSAPAPTPRASPPPAEAGGPARGAADRARDLLQPLAPDRDPGAARQLATRDELLQRLISQVPGCLYRFRLDPDGHMSMPYASEGFRDLFQLEPASVRDDAGPLLARVHPEDREPLLQGIRRSAREGSPWRAEFRVRFPECGETCWREAHAAPQRLADGAVLWHGHVSDITERKAAEGRLRLAASVFTHTHDGIIITDPDARIVDVNPRFSHITGYAREEVVGQTPRLLKSGFHGPQFYADLWRRLREQGHWRGEIRNRRKSGGTYTEMLAISAVHDAGGRVTHYVGVFSDISHVKQQQQRLEQLAHYDVLTQLPNRLLLADRLELALAQAQRAHNLLAVGYLDLDAFKPVNDQHGHETGDALLVEVAQRLRRTVRAGDTVARLGGDEFVLLLTGLHDLAECRRILERVLAAVSTPFSVRGLELRVSGSLGATIYPDDGADADTLLRHADQAMYQAKQAGRSRYQLFDSNHERHARVQQAATGRVQEALEAGELVLHYQPQVDMRQGRVTGAEALLRWQHPQRGLLAPGHFLHHASTPELATALDDWVIRTALAQLEAWWAQGLELTVSVNVSARHLQQAHFVDRLGELLAAHPGAPARAFVLEVLETAALEDLGQVGMLVEGCRTLGVGFSLDDFGTGYSSLTYLKRLPADELKIDRSFVGDMLDDPGDLAIVEGVIGLANAFQRRVIAEGVESEDHGVLLMQLGCDQAQGYAIARPMPAAGVPDWAAAWAPSALWRDAARDHWAPRDFPLLTAEIEHRRWVRRVVEPAERGEVPAEPPDEETCRFGRWYHGPGRRQYGHLATFDQVGMVHRRTHALARETRRLAANGRGERAAACRAELAATHQDMSRLLRSLREATRGRE